MKALYRKYRPTKLSEVVGEEQVTKILAEGLKKGKIAHSYLFIGPRGCGKTSVARIFAHEINGFKYELEDFYPDILEIDAASNTGVDNIRELRERAAIAPTEGKYKVYIIDEVHMLSKSAFNALLKTLEEPPAHVIFIMATTDVYKVPSTIISRSQVYEFQLASPEVMKKHLKKIAEQEGIKITDEALDIVVRRGGGSFRDSISILDQISTISSDEITADLITSSLGLPEETKLTALLDAYLSGSLAEISARLKDLLNSGTRAEIIAEELIDRIVASPSADLLPLLKTLSTVSAPFPEAKLLLAFTDSLTHPKVELKADVAKSGTRFATGSQAAESGIHFPADRPQAAAEVERPSPVKTGARSACPQEVNSLSATGAFNWRAYLETVRTGSPSLADILGKTTQSLDGTTLKIIPEKPIYKTILTSKNNTKILKDALPEDFALQILDPDEQVISTTDPHISKLNDIMGGKVMEVKIDNGGNNPF